MSGVKYSKVEIMAEKKAQQEALKNINTFKENILILKDKVETLIKEIPEGVLNSFSNEEKMVKKWLNEELPEYSEQMNSSKLKSVEKIYENLATQGKDVVKKLIEIKEVRRDEKAKVLLGEIELRKSELKGLEKLMNKWKPGEFAKQSAKIEVLPAQMDKGEFIQVEEGLKGIEQEIRKLEQELKNLQAQDEQRWWVLEKLRIVCKDQLGWGEEGEPALEDENDPASPIVYKVDTYNSGKIEFSLRLEGIRVDSEISNEDDLCYKEFKNLSENLKEFGIITEFKQQNVPRQKPVDHAQRALPRKTKVRRRQA